MNKVDITLYGILDPEHSRGRPLPELAAAAVEGGATLLQYRDKYADSGTRARIAGEIMSAIAGTGVPLIVNDDPHAAHESGCGGVHLGREDMTPKEARELLGPDATIGLSVKTPEDAMAVDLDRADYVFVGGVFATQSKDNPTAIGLEGWKQLAALIRGRKPGMPVGAIAGITPENVGDVIGAGADGVSVISAIFMAEDVAGAARELRRLVEEARA